MSDVTGGEPPIDQLADDDDELDASGVDFAAEPTSDDELELMALFPDGVPDEARAEEWRALEAALPGAEPVGGDGSDGNHGPDPA